jgi:2-C-methyl-D-erythritol 4-phosphate cytidylyltransferase
LNEEYALIVAGGKGTRIKSQTPKQFIALEGLPILLHTINAFFRYSENIRVILVLPADDFSTWHALVKKYDFQKPVILQQGGASRFQSVKQGLAKIKGNGLVAIHDGVRPLVSESIIAASFRLAASGQSAVAAVPLKDSIRLADNGLSKALDRSQYRLIQTPQTFSVALIKEAYTLPEDETLTDDASIAERAGHRISLFEGSYRNIKITTEEDLIVAAALLRK